MAKLGNFVRNGVAMREGEWIDAGAEYAGIQVKTRAMGTAYADCRNGKMRRAARLAGGEEHIAQAEKNRIDIEALGETCLLDIRGLQHPDGPDGSPGADVTIEEFRALILQEEASELAIMAFKCAGRVGQASKQQAEEASGN